MLDELKTLENGQFYVVAAAENAMMKLKVFVIGATCDKPAQSLVQNTAEPIGKYGCGQCEIPGEKNCNNKSNFFLDDLLFNEIIFILLL